MLALADRHGVVEASVPGLADMARVSREECDAALLELSSPDPDSRSRNDQGRRVRQIDGGWQILNHAKYRDKMSIDERNARNAAYMREFRKRKTVSVPGPLHVSSVEQAAPIAETPSDASSNGNRAEETRIGRMAIRQLKPPF